MTPLSYFGRGERVVTTVHYVLKPGTPALQYFSFRQRKESRMHLCIAKLRRLDRICRKCVALELLRVRASECGALRNAVNEQH